MPIRDDHGPSACASRPTRSLVYEFVMGLVDEVVLREATCLDHDVWREMSALFDEAIEAQWKARSESLELQQQRVSMGVINT